MLALFRFILRSEYNVSISEGGYVVDVEVVIKKCPFFNG
jgi:hypothetical protein